MPFPGDEFLDYGSAASSKEAFCVVTVHLDVHKLTFISPLSAAFPTFFDVSANDLWDPATHTYEQPRFNDWTHVDSLAAPIAGLIVFVVVQWLERDAPLVNFKEDGVMGKSFSCTQSYYDTMI